MSCSYTTAELKRIAIEQDGPEAEMAIEVLESRGDAPEDTFEEHHGQTMMEAKR